MSRRTDTGFVMGAAEVICVASIKGYAVLWVQTEHVRYELIVTPKGRKISVKGPYPPVLR